MYSAYFIHYTKNIKRRSYIENKILPEISGEFITGFDREEIAGSEAKFYSYSRKESKIATAIIYKTMLANVFISQQISIPKEVQNKFFLKKDRECFEALTPKILSKTNLSLNLKHREAWRRLAESESKYGLIMEDDVILKEEKKHELKNEINELLMLDADYIDLGGGAGLHPTEGWPFTKEEKKQDVYVVSTKSTRTTCAYLIRKQLAIDLLKLKEPILFPIDIQLTYLFQCIEAKVLWPKDELFIHGSEHGYYNVSNER